MDKTTLADKKILRNNFKCSVHTNMDSSQCIFAGCNNEEEIKIGTGTLHNPTDFKHKCFEKVPVNQLVKNMNYENNTASDCKQLKMVDLYPDSSDNSNNFLPIKPSHESICVKY
jgi:hypothetical protein